MSTKKTRKAAGKKSRGSVKKSTAKTARAAKATKPVAAAKPMSYAASWKVAADTKNSAKQRVQALTNMVGSVCDDQRRLQNVLGVLQDASEAVPVRLAALQTMQSESFSAPNFDACRPDYLAALRAVSADPDPEIRQRVLGILAREHDGYAQQVLVDGLREPEKALLPPEKALQLLSYDIHSEAYPVAREIVRNPPSAIAKREALRMLAADAASTPLFEEMLRSKEEAPEIRQLSASALNTLAPAKLQEHAREMVVDTAETESMKATSLSAITQFGKQEDVANDSVLLESVNDLATGTGSADLKQVSRSFLSKHRR